MLLPYNPGRQLTGRIPTPGDAGAGSALHVALRASSALALCLRRNLLFASGDHSEKSGGEQPTWVGGATRQARGGAGPCAIIDTSEVTEIGRWFDRIHALMKLRMYS